MEHTITLDGIGIYRCDEEGCISEECTDYDRCSYGCVCNRCPVCNTPLSEECGHPEAVSIWPGKVT